MFMSRKFYGLIAAAIVLPAAVFVSGCSDGEEEELVGNWEKVSDFDGVARCSAVTFSVGGTVYVSSGGYGGYGRKRGR